MREIRYKYKIINSSILGMTYKKFKTMCCYNNDIRHVYVGSSGCTKKCDKFIYRDYNNNTVHCVGDEYFEPNRKYYILLIEKKCY